MRFFIRNRLTRVFSFHALQATRPFWVAVLAIVVAQLVQTYWPPFQRLFNTTALSLYDVFVVRIVALIFLMIIEAEKQLRIRWLN